jgi:hypothetical protein
MRYFINRAFLFAFNTITPYPLAFLFFLYSCKMQPFNNTKKDTADNTYKIKLKAKSGSNYQYDIKNNSNISLEVNDKKIETITKTEIGTKYSIDTDSLGNYLLGLSFNKIHIYQKKADQESDIDASTDAEATDPTSKTLHQLLNTNIEAKITKAGEIDSVIGYQAMVDQILTEESNLSFDAKETLRQQCNKMIEDNLIKKNMKQLLNFFPDSAIHVGDKWKMLSKEDGDIPFTVKNIFKLQSIEDGIATIESTGELLSDSTASSILGYSLSTSLKGEEKGMYELDITTGMLTNSEVYSNISGSLQVLGRDIPISIKITKITKGKKL